MSYPDFGEEKKLQKIKARLSTMTGRDGGAFSQEDAQKFVRLIREGSTSDKALEEIRNEQQRPCTK